MSVVATVKVYDGIVLGVESMAQLIANIGGAAQVVKAYENAQKIFQVGDWVGVMTYGIGNIGMRSIDSFVHEFSRAEGEAANVHPAGPALAPRPNVEEVAGRFYTFMQGHHAHAFGTMPQAQQPGIGFVIAGYSTGQHLASELEFVLPQDTAPRRVRNQDDIGASWRGVAAPFTRLMFGIDPSLEQLLTQAGATPQELQRLSDVVQQGATRVAFDGMPLQDAIGYCRFIIQTTIGWCMYALGTPACGGPIRLAVITPRAGFEWVTPLKHYIEGGRHGH